MIKSHFSCFASDLWALGWIIYEWLVGFSPFTGKSTFEIEENIWNENVQFPQKFNKHAKDLIKRLLK